MTDYIEREALIEHIKDLPTWRANAGGYYSDAQKLPDGLFEPEDVIASIENAPAADVEPVVRCPACKYRHDCGDHFCVRLGMDLPNDSEFFCKYGERLEG